MTKLRLHNTKSATLTPELVLAAHRRYDTGLITQGALARELGISLTQMARILRWESWSHLKDVYEGRAALPQQAAIAGFGGQVEVDLTERAAASASALERLLAAVPPDPLADLAVLRGGAPAASTSPQPAAGAADSEEAGVEVSGSVVLPPLEEPAEPSKGE